MCVGNSMVYITRNLSVSPPKRRDKGGSHMNRAIGICRYRTRGVSEVVILAGGHSVTEYLEHPSTDSVSIISSLSTHTKNLACPKYLPADAARSPQRSVRLVTVLCATVEFPFCKISLLDKNHFHDRLSKSIMINIGSVASVRRITHILISMPQTVHFFILQLMLKCLVVQGASLF